MQGRYMVTGNQHAVWLPLDDTDMLQMHALHRMAWLSVTTQTPTSQTTHTCSLTASMVYRKAMEAKGTGKMSSQFHAPGA